MTNRLERPLDAMSKASTRRHDVTTSDAEAAKTCRKRSTLASIDIYMAKISPRAGRSVVLPHDAVRQLFQQNPRDPLSMAVIKTVGAHPPGSLVKLRSGEVAVAIRRSAEGPHPLVATLSDRHG